MPESTRKKTARRAGELGPERLRASLDPMKIPFEDSREVPAKDGYALFQPRARQALDLALKIKGNDFNVFVAGEANLGRTYFARGHLAPAAAKAPTPPDWIYVHNFDDPDRPIALSLEPGRGKLLKATQAQVMQDIREEIPAGFEQESFHKEHEVLLKGFNAKRDRVMGRMEDSAGKEGFSLAMDDHGGPTLSLIVDGKVLGDKDFEALDPARRKRLKEKGEELLAGMSACLRRMAKDEKDLRQEEKRLRRDTAKAVLDEHLGRLRAMCPAGDDFADYYLALEKEILENVDLFLTRDPWSGHGTQGPEQNPGLDDLFGRLEINLFVDNSRTRGAPVVVCEHPTPFKLLGSIEREAEMGALHTDYTLIRAGDLHRANHGFLIINVQDLLANPGSWEGLLRALRLGQARIEDPVDPDQARTRTIEPDPVPLEIRIVLVGTDETYETLLYHDDRFQKYFKLKAHLQADTRRNAQGVRSYLTVLARIVRDAGLMPFTRRALAGLVDFSSRLAEDQRRLSLFFPLIRERMVEASALAAQGARPVVEAEDLSRAIAARDFRVNLFEEEYMTEYDREVIKVATGGSAVGRANGLSVTLFGDYEFGLPHQISCTVGVGHGGILDLEREAQLGGPIHTKGMMIIKSYLTGLFAQDKPIVLTGSLCFEQSYAGIEGDSASGAELAALLSALSGLPINLSLAFTGAVSQSGAVMAVGAVNRKIEGFFEVCRRRGLSGRQGVVFPADNLVNLMLKDEVVEAVRQGTFHLYPVKTIGQALFILTGVAAGKRQKHGAFPRGTVYRLVDERLAELAKLAADIDKTGRV